MSRYKFFEGAKKIESIVNQDIYSLLITDKDIWYKIPKEEEYRPDLISQRFYGNPKLSWILIYANKFGNSPEDFITDRMIRITNYNRVMEII